MALHEIGHALGLRHPGNYTQFGGGGIGNNTPPYLRASEDNSTNTVMSYNGDYAGPEPRPYDIAALRFFYGATVPASGQWTLSTGGSSNVVGSSLSELIAPGPGGHSIDGGGGTDIGVYSAPSNQYATSLIDGTIKVTGPGGITDSLANVERLQFSDKKLAIDLSVTGSAGQAVEILGAAFGREVLAAHKHYLGLGIQLFDSGRSMLQIAQLCVETGLVSSPDNASFVAAVWLNVVGSPIDAANLANYMGLLQGSGGSLTQAQLLPIAATCQPNVDHVGLLGLAATGIEYS